MKNRAFAMFSCLTALTAAGAFAQSTAVLRADIPFEFRVGGRCFRPDNTRWSLRPVETCWRSSVSIARRLESWSVSSGSRRQRGRTRAN